MHTLFISDLHLHESRPQVTRAFFQFLQTQAIHAEALYILGDFFDVWIGDDDDTQLLQDVADELFALKNKGVTIFYLHGNRDFLLGNNYANKAGMTLIPDGTVINLYGTPTLLMHGDSLCTSDVSYQQFRKLVRSAPWQDQFLAQSISARRAIAAQLREKSESMNSMKAEDIMDVSPAEVITQMEAAGVAQLIHGHTHRPARHQLVIDGKAAERIVLGDWHDSGWCIKADENTIKLIDWKI